MIQNEGEEHLKNESNGFEFVLKDLVWQFFGILG